MYNGGLNLTLAAPLKFEHFSGWYDYPGQRTDLRSRVMTKFRNVKIQGDAWSEVGVFGCRTGAFFGGIYRVENVEFFRCGQSGLLGGYPTHFHRDIIIFQPVGGSGVGVQPKFER